MKIELRLSNFIGTNRDLPTGPEEMSAFIKNLFLPDEWKSLESVIVKFHPGGLTGLFKACSDFFETKLGTNMPSAEVLRSMDATSLAYEFLNQLGVERKAFDTINDQQRNEYRSVVEKLFRILVQMVLPIWLKALNTSQPGSGEVVMQMLDKTLNDVVAIEGGNIDDIQRILLPAPMVDATIIEEDAKTGAYLYWEPKFKLRDLNFLAQLLQKDYDALLSGPKSFVQLFDKMSNSKTPAIWNKKKSALLLVLIDKLYTDDTLPLKMSFGKGYWKASQELFTDRSGKPLYADFNKAISKLKGNPKRYDKTVNEVKQIIDDVRRFTEMNSNKTKN